MKTSIDEMDKTLAALLSKRGINRPEVVFSLYNRVAGETDMVSYNDFHTLLFPGDVIVRTFMSDGRYEARLYNATLIDLIVQAEYAWRLGAGDLDHRFFEGYTTIKENNIPVVDFVYGS